jgi:hypothetical protein
MIFVIVSELVTISAFVSLSDVVPYVRFLI